MSTEDAPAFSIDTTVEKKITNTEDPVMAPPKMSRNAC